VVPSAVTSITLRLKQKQYHLLYKRIKRYTRYYTLMIRPDIPWAEKVATLKEDIERQ
jgi:hypothetical protein